MKIHERAFFYDVTPLPEEAVRNCKISCVPVIDASSCESERAICRAKESPDEKFMQSRGST